MNYKTLAEKVRYYKTTEKGETAMNEKLLKLIEEEKIEYFANFLKLGLNVEDIKKALKISDKDFETIYPLALKLAQ
jgi:arsenate reductase-like glutaredoxin family protein